MRHGVGPAQIGVIVAGDPPAREVERIVAGQCEPVALKFRSLDGRPDFEVPVRDLTPVEICTVINRALEQKRIEFGVRPYAGGPVLVGGQ